MILDLTWENLGDIEEGRPTLGADCPVVMYRMLQFSLRKVIETELGEGKGGEFLYKAGQQTGRLIYEKFFSDEKDAETLFNKLADLLYDLKVCILRVEKADFEKVEFIITAEEDLDCSGVPEIGWPICQYDEGFVSGLLSFFTGETFLCEEVDCWTTGARICRIEAKIKASE